MARSIGLVGTAGGAIGKKLDLFRGETGFFRITMHHSNLGIENDCTWGVPIVAY
jgi:hypothetical protein